MVIVLVWIDWIRMFICWSFFIYISQSRYRPAVPGSDPLSAELKRSWDCPIPILLLTLHRWLNLIDVFSKEWAELMFATDYLPRTGQGLEEKSGRPTIH